MNILYNIFSNIKLKELSKVKSFNIFDLIKDREFKRNYFKYENYTNKQIGDLFVADIIKGNEDLLIEYLRKILVEKISNKWPA
jgi:glutaredoxin-related protein